MKNNGDISDNFSTASRHPDVALNVWAKTKN